MIITITTTISEEQAWHSNHNVTISTCFNFILIVKLSNILFLEMNSIEEITTYSSKQQISQKPKKQETAAHLAPRL
jgi:large-conductance mechanosensitive channel